MNVADALRGIRRLGLDASPIIYFVERHPVFGAIAAAIFYEIERTTLTGVASALTYTKTLTKPIALRDLVLVRSYRRLLSQAPGILCPVLGRETAERAAFLRAAYGLKTPDALHIAAAITAGCDAFLTNDVALKRVTLEIPVIVISELTLL